MDRGSHLSTMCMLFYLSALGVVWFELKALNVVCVETAECCQEVDEMKLTDLK